MACRICPGCDRRWPVRNAFFNCPFCACVTSWSSAQPTATAEDQKQASEIMARIEEMRSDIAELERYAAGSSRLLSFPICLNRWPTASDVPGPASGAKPEA